MNKVSATLILDTMKSWIEERQPISPHQWLDASAKLNILRGDIDAELYEIEHYLAVKKADMMVEENMTHARAETFIKAQPEYKELRLKQSKIKQIEEFIRIAKKQASLVNEEYKNS